MNLLQRAVGLIYVLLSLCNLITTIGMVTLLISISSGLPLIAYKSEADFHTLLQLVCVCVMTEWLDDCVVALLTGYRIAISEGHCNYWIAPCKQHIRLTVNGFAYVSLDHAAALVQAFLPKWLQSKTFEFTASGSVSDSKQNEMAAHNTRGLRRVLRTLRTEKLGFHTAYIMLCGAGLVRSCSLILYRPHSSFNTLALDFVVRIGWPPLLWLVCLNAFTVPIRYAFQPPSIPNRAQLLKRDPVRRASYPQHVGEAGEEKTFGSEHLCYSLIMVYVFLLFVCTLWFA